MVRDITERKRAEAALRQSYVEIKQLKDRLQAESEYLKAEIRVREAHHEIIGRSRVIMEVLHLVEQVAPTDSVVLLTGETGTGKELEARAIHRLSPRKDRLMIEVNCAALPEALLESELFGRERGPTPARCPRQWAASNAPTDGSTIVPGRSGRRFPSTCKPNCCTRCRKTVPAAGRHPRPAKSMSG